MKTGAMTRRIIRSIASDRVRAAGIVFTLALVIRLIYSFTSFRHYFNNDSVGFHNLAVNLATGNGYSSSIVPPYDPHFMREPGYPLFLASVYYLYSLFEQPKHFVPAGYYDISVYPETAWAHVAQSILGAATCVIFLFLLRLRLKPGISFATALLFAAYLPLAAFSALLLRETLQTFFVVAMSYCFARFLLSSGRGWLIGFSVLWALSNLTLQITILLFAPVFIFCWIWFRSFRRSLGYTTLSTAIMLLVVSPWLIRTYLFYPDIRVLKSFGTSLTSEARDYGFSQFSLNMAGVISRDSSLENIHREFYGVPERVKFERSFSGYYAAEAEKARQALSRSGRDATVRTPVTALGWVKHIVAYIRHCWIESLWVVERPDNSFDLRPHGYYRVVEPNDLLFGLSLLGFLFGYAAFPGMFLFYRRLFPLMMMFTYFLLLIPIVGDEERRFLPAHAFIFLFSCLFFFYAYLRWVKKKSPREIGTRIFRSAALSPVDIQGEAIAPAAVPLEA
jgi:hypothetical protein